MLPVDLVGDVGIGVQAEDFGRVVGRQQGHVFQVSGDSARVGRVALRPIDYIKKNIFSSHRRPTTFQRVRGLVVRFFFLFKTRSLTRNGGSGTANQFDIDEDRLLDDDDDGKGASTWGGRA